MRALVVEDDDASIELMLATLRGHAEVEVATSLADALPLAPDADVVFLDLGLPDSDGFDSLAVLRSAIPTTAIVVITGSSDPELPVQVVEAGAQEFISKDSLSGLIERATLAISRQRYHNRMLAQALHPPSRRAFDAAMLLEVTPVTGRHLGVSSLQESLPDVFARLVSDYSEVLDSALTARAYRDQIAPTSRIRAMGHTVAAVSASARDVIEVHLAALEDLGDVVGPERFGSLHDESRNVLVQLLGYAMMSYRTRTFGVPPPDGSGNQ